MTMFYNWKKVPPEIRKKFEGVHLSHEFAKPGEFIKITKSYENLDEAMLKATPQYFIERDVVFLYTGKIHEYIFHKYSKEYEPHTIKVKALKAIVGHVYTKKL